MRNSDTKSRRLLVCRWPGLFITVKLSIKKILASRGVTNLQYKFTGVCANAVLFTFAGARGRGTLCSSTAVTVWLNGPLLSASQFWSATKEFLAVLAITRWKRKGCITKCQTTESLLIRDAHSKVSWRTFDKIWIIYFCLFLSFRVAWGL